MCPFTIVVELMASILLFRCGIDGIREGGEGLFLGLVMVAVGAISTYLFPAWIALHRKVVSAEIIVRTTLMYGWTAVGWGVALYWALSDPVQKSATKS